MEYIESDIPIERKFPDDEIPSVLYASSEMQQQLMWCRVIEKCQNVERQFHDVQVRTDQLSVKMWKIKNVLFCTFKLSHMSVKVN